MIYGSVCSGIEAASVAWEPLGWKCAFVSEVEPFACAMLRHYWPEVPNYGDLNECERWPKRAVDVLVGGTPCQDFSVAGQRAGMAGARGGLTMRFLDCVGRYAPTWVVWENVPGVLSIDGGGAFGAFLGGLAKLGYGFAYRVLDAQYFGLAQRRERVFVVGRAGGAWQRAAAVLFDGPRLRWNPPPRREAGKGIAATISGSPPSRRNGGSDPTSGHFVETAPSVPASGSGFERTGESRGQDCVIPVAGTLSAANGKTRGAGIQPESIVATITKNYATMHGRTSGNNGGIAENHLIAHSLTAEGHDASEDGTGRGVPLGAFRAAGQEGFTPSTVSPPVSATDGGGAGVPTIAFTERTRADGRNFESQENLAYAVTNPGSGGRTHSRQIAHGMAVRRLTPREVERLFGFPDDYTLIPYRGKPAVDSPRYRALGSSFAVPVIRWIGRRIELVEGLK